MDTGYLLALLISTLVFVVVPLLIIGLAYFMLKKKASKKLAVAVSLVLLGISAYYLISGFYPRDSFYIDNLKENTELTLPKSARLICNSGTNSIYNFGDYNLSYMYQFDQADYDKLYLELIDKGFKHNNTYLETTENEKILSRTPNLKSEKILTKDYGFKNFDVLFLSDHKTVVFNSNKW